MGESSPQIMANLSVRWKTIKSAYMGRRRRAAQRYAAIKNMTLEIKRIKVTREMLITQAAKTNKYKCNEGEKIR